VKRSRRGKLRKLTIHGRRRKLARNAFRGRLSCPAQHDGAPCRQRLVRDLPRRLFRCNRRHYEVSYQALDHAETFGSGRLP